MLKTLQQASSTKDALLQLSHRYLGSDIASDVTLSAASSLSLLRMTLQLVASSPVGAIMRNQQMNEHNRFYTPPG